MVMVSVVEGVNEYQAVLLIPTAPRVQASPESVLGSPDCTVKASVLCSPRKGIAGTGQALAKLSLPETAAGDGEPVEANTFSVRSPPAKPSYEPIWIR